ncbi:TIGR04255 family protein [Leptolyngbya sp. CCNP1308]|uniref:TIGR04255 family protein n=1 Tax=Leptolyngbya sp. CCNP1308 TaxID=3110255 RepID=UPI002B1E9B06|nr:TIGR04255 family protein [Leptolyngbya sp. CCNP1308]MEA5448794.1 TIGR04255 family protein [Leptolyngbya sp. CCNP1308]
MTETSQTLPDFEEPPVVENVIGVEFNELNDWSIMSFAEFWQVIQEEYPRYETQPPVTTTSVQDLVLEYGFPGKFPVRFWFHHSSEAQLLQVQSDRFLYNWRKYITEGTYPRYEKTIRPEFIKEWTRFCDFLQQKGIESPQVKKCEITYVNHFEKSREWESLEDMPEMFRFWQKGISSVFLPSASSLAFQIVYPIPEIDGSLLVNMQPALRNSDSKDIIQLSLTAVGKPNSSTLEDVLDCLDTERQWIVNSFLDITTERMHEIWGIKKI